jgi:hypothetical protein
MGSSARLFREEQSSRRKEISRLFERKRKTIAFQAVVFFYYYKEKKCQNELRRLSVLAS